MMCSVGLPLLLLLLASTTPDAIKETEEVPINTQKSNPKHKDNPQFSSNQVEAAKYLRKALAHFDKKEYKEVAKLCEDAIEIDPTMAFSYAMLGNVMNLLHDWKKGAESWKKAAELEPDNFEYFFHLGYSMEQCALDEVSNKKKFQFNRESLASFEKYLQLSNGKAEKSQISMAHTHMGKIYKGIKTQDKQALALEHFEKAIELDVTNELAFFNLGLIYSERFEKTQSDDDKSTALENIEKAMELNPKNQQFSLVRDALLGKVDPSEFMASMQKTEL